MAGGQAKDMVASAVRRSFLRRWIGKRLMSALVAVLVLLVAGMAVLNSPIGKRFIVDEIAKVAPASGLKVRIGRIDGNIYGQATFHDVRLFDPQGKFLAIPEVELDWRPFSWLLHGLDIRKLVIKRGQLERLPKLLPGDPNAPILPNFDIRIDRFEIDHLTARPGVAGPQTHVINLLGQSDIRKGRVFFKTDGTLGTQDKLHALIDAEPDGDKFDVDIDYRAAKDGVLAGLTGAQAAYDVSITGHGTWTKWRGAMLADRGARRVASFKLTNDAGQYGLIGQADGESMLGGVPGNALGRQAALDASATLVGSVLNGKATLIGRGLTAKMQGALDLGRNQAKNLAVKAQLTDPNLLGTYQKIDGATLNATMDGPFSDLRIAHTIRIGRLALGSTIITDVVQKGTARRGADGWSLPLSASVEQVATGVSALDPELVKGRLGGIIRFAKQRLTSDNLTIAFPRADARLALRGDLARRAWSLSGPVKVAGVPLNNIGALTGSAKVSFAVAGKSPWSLLADFDAKIPQVSNPTLANLAGPAIALRGGVTVNSAGPSQLRRVAIGASNLSLGLSGSFGGGAASVAGKGKQAQYGNFTVQAGLTQKGPNAVLVFAMPVPAADLANVRIAIAPSAQGFAIDSTGDSALGPFKGRLGISQPAGGPARIAIEQFNIWKTSVTGVVTLDRAGAAGKLNLSGGGLSGTIGIAPQTGGQAVDLNLTARNAVFGGAIPISVAKADIVGTGKFASADTASPARNKISGSIFAQGLGYGRLFVGRLAAKVDLTNGEGTVTGSLSGRRGSRFDLQLNANIAHDRMAVAGQGEFAGRKIRMPRQAVLLRQEMGGWQLEPTQISYGRGISIAAGSFGGGGPTRAHIQLANMPLSLVDIAFADTGLGGTISGLVDFEAMPGQAPSGTAQVKVKGLTRSGLVLSSRPVDVSLLLRLAPGQLDAGAAFQEDGKTLGQLQGRISGLPADGPLIARLQAGQLLARLRYDGPADAMWRLAAVEAFDLTGPLTIAADMTGSLADPRVKGSVSSDDLRVQSALSGTDISNVTARGDFAGSRLQLRSFSGKAANGGSVVGSGTIDFLDIGTRGPQIDLKIAAKNANLLNTGGLDATVTGPLRLISDGVGGTIAGRLEVDRASWRLGTAAEAAQLPQIRTTQINAPADIGPVTVRRKPWRYLIDAHAASRVDVKGMGLDSEWSADIKLRGTTAEPRMGGRADVIRGAYSFAGTRFNLSRGKIEFDVNGPIDPRLDILAETSVTGLDVSVTVKGNALRPEIAFTSNPALPEEEILARLLFGGSITQLSATDALQLGAALASLRGGAGVDPINKLRTAIGLDRLRIVSADPALGRGTGVALGKNIGRRIYVEIITDGRGYSASQVEFRITGWLALLGSVSTVGRQSVLAEISKDY